MSYLPLGVPANVQAYQSTRRTLFGFGGGTEPPGQAARPTVRRGAPARWRRRPRPRWRRRRRGHREWRPGGGAVIEHAGLPVDLVEGEQHLVDQLPGGTRGVPGPGSAGRGQLAVRRPRPGSAGSRSTWRRTAGEHAGAAGRRRQLVGDHVAVEGVDPGHTASRARPRRGAGTGSRAASAGPGAGAPLPPTRRMPSWWAAMASWAGRRRRRSDRPQLRGSPSRRATSSRRARRCRPARPGRRRAAGRPAGSRR